MRSIMIEEYRKKINHSKIFNKEVKEEYLHEYDNLKNDIFSYVYLTNQNAGEFNVEILETLNNCIKYYQPDKGDFVNYFNASLKKRLRAKKRDIIIEQKICGMSISEGDRRTIAKHYKTEADRPEHDPVNLKRKTNGAFGEKQYDEVLARWRLFSSGSRFGLSGEFMDPGEHPSFENREASESLCISGNLVTEDLLSIINEVYLTCNENQKSVISLLLTTKLLPVCLEIDGTLKILYAQDFYNAIVLEWYRRKNCFPHQKEIAEYLGKPSSEISRLFSLYKKNFMKSS